jgi:hypothetical protein
LASSFIFPDTQFNVEAYGPFGITLSLIMMLAVFLTSVGTRKRIPYLPASRVNNDKAVGAVGFEENLFRNSLGANESVFSLDVRWRVDRVRHGGRR